MPNKTIVVSICNNDYTVKFPNSGEQMDIDIIKLELTNNKYDTLKFSFNPSFQRNALRVDAVSTFQILIPALKKDLNVKSLFLLEEEQMQVVTDAYEETFLPWYEEWLTILNKPKEQAK